MATMPSFYIQQKNTFIEVVSNHITFIPNLLKICQFCLKVKTGEHTCQQHCDLICLLFSFEKRKLWNHKKDHHSHNIQSYFSFST